MYNDFQGKAKSGEFLTIRRRCEVTKVQTKEILYIEKELRNIHVYTKECKHTFYGKMEDIMPYLGPTFFRCHKSCIVNFDRVISMKMGVFYFEGGCSLMIGKNNYQNAKRHYSGFLNNAFLKK